MLEYASMNPRLKEMVAKRPGGERVQNCYQCGTCTGGCPVSAMAPEYNPRVLMKKLLLGMEEAVLSAPELWLCSQCHVCVAHCPQDVRFADVLRVLREIAAEAGYAPADRISMLDGLEQEIKETRLQRLKKLLSGSGDTP